MSYVVAIKTAIIVFPIIAFLITIPFILHNYHKYGSVHYLKTLVIYSFILYLITVYFLVILPLPSFEAASKIPGPHFNFIPFNFIKDFINETSLVLSNPSTYLTAIKEPCFYVVIFNIFMTIPFGMYLHYYFKCDFKKTVFYTFLLSLFFELTQGTGLYFIYPNPYRLCDIDDLILNTTGGIVGFGLMKLIEKFLPSRDEIDRKALEKGQVVSGLRRITVFCLDLFIYFIISTIIYFVLNNKNIYLIIFLLYYIIIPIMIKNQTLGMNFLNVRMSYPNHDILRNSIRIIFTHFYYLILPFLLVYFTFLIFNSFNNTHTTIFIFLMSIIFILIFYLTNILILLIKKKIYYDKIFKFKYESTINELKLK